MEQDFDIYGLPKTRNTYDTFWMVFSPAQGPAKKTHLDYQSAKEEAHRLAKKHPGLSFFLLQATKMFMAETPVNEYILEEK